MAGTEAQNVQRGVVFVFFLIYVYYFVMCTIALIKKQIDPLEDDAEGEAYRDKEQGESGENAAAPNNPYKVDRTDSEANFDSSAIRAEQPKEDDPTIVKVVKKTRLTELLLFPLLIVIPLNVLTGTSKAFLFVNFFFILVCLVLFNIIRVHRKAEEAGHKCVNVVLDNLWLLFAFFMLVNQWGADPISQPYIITG